MNVADTRAALVRLWEGVLAPPGHWPRLDRLTDAPAPPGWAVWRAGGEGGPLTALPALLPSAPLDVRHRYLARVVANTTGRCPMCSAVPSITPDSPTPERPEPGTCCRSRSAPRTRPTARPCSATTTASTSTLALSLRRTRHDGPRTRLPTVCRTSPPRR